LFPGSQIGTNDFTLPFVIKKIVHMLIECIRDNFLAGAKRRKTTLVDKYNRLKKKELLPLGQLISESISVTDNDFEWLKVNPTICDFYAERRFCKGYLLVASALRLFQTNPQMKSFYADCGHNFPLSIFLVCTLDRNLMKRN